MVYGYIRVSTFKQAKDGNSLEAQTKLLLEAGSEKIFSDTISGATKIRPELNRMIDCLVPGDKVIITKLDRIARSVQDGLAIIETIISKGAVVNVLNMGIIDNSPSGKLIRTMFLAFSEFERDLIIERTKEGKDIARRKPNFKDGRPKKYTKIQLEHAMQLLNNHSYKQVAELTGISKATLYREKHIK